MSSTQLVKAKIQTPRFRSGLVERGELEQALRFASASRRLVLLVAPAGYGKTAALSRLVQLISPERAVVWLTADEEDDLRRYLAHLIEALEPLDLPWRLAPEVLLDLVTQGRSREAADTLLDALHATDLPEGAVIILDDLHAAADPQIFEFLRYLLEGLPRSWTMVFSTRVEPPLALGLPRWRARAEIAEFDEGSLRFSDVEVQALWRQAIGRDDPEHARLLGERTQGWVAGLCLCLEASESSAANAAGQVWRSRRHLFEYLAQEVFEHLPDDMQAFLLRCCLLPELTVARCEQVSGNPYAAELLRQIERRRLFVSLLDVEELTLRLHDLFRDFLEERLRRTCPEEVPSLLRRVAETEVDPVRRTLAYLQAGMWNEALLQLTEATPDMLAADAGTEVMRVVRQFPADLQEQSPWLAHIRALCMWTQDQYSAVQTAMHRAAAGFDELGEHDRAQSSRAVEALSLFFCRRDEEARRLIQIVRSRPMNLETETLSELLDFWHEAYHGTIDGPARRLSRVVVLLQQGGSAALWARCMTSLNMFVGRPGVSAQMRRMVAGAIAKAGIDEGRQALRLSARLTEIWLLLWQARIADLEGAFQRLEDDARWLGQPASLRMRLLLQKVNYHVICDNREAARATCDAIIAQASALDPSSHLPPSFLAVVVGASGAIGHWDRVRDLLPDFEAAIGKDNIHIHAFLRTFKAELALREGRVDEALAALRQLANVSAQLNTTYLDALVRTRLALAELAAGSPTAAWQALGPLIERTMATGNIGEVLGTGGQVLNDLARASWRGVTSEPALAALRGWIDDAHRLGSAREAGLLPDRHAPELSARETEVLALLAAGQSNKAVARTLNLSPHTVKRHVARILDRLDVSSRTQAARWYHEHVGDA
ncbi:LuxR C-terminal-related transcriptional regulator [Variovorax sp. KK3]|uniref:helix-turn-helix transcriptional regulator n=1 Tax=Variovorax sp. KK3 TaxID=1855728 RepID=UPI00097C7BDD|nr:LuxR C-terminal-related transcriptional regulator [Variovorax sp. KK3]